MDNKTYLDQIASKGTPKHSIWEIFTPRLIKIILSAIFVIILSVIVGNILSRDNNYLKDDYAELYFKIAFLNDEEGPLHQYSEKLKSSDLRAYTISLQSVLDTILPKFDALSSQLGFSTASPNSTVGAIINTEQTQLLTELEEAYYNGQLDIKYAYNLASKLNLIIASATALRDQTPVAEFANLLNDAINNLKLIQKDFKTFSETHQ